MLYFSKFVEGLSDNAWVIFVAFSSTVLYIIISVAIYFVIVFSKEADKDYIHPYTLEQSMKKLRYYFVIFNCVILLLNLIFAIANLFAI